MAARPGARMRPLAPLRARERAIRDSGATDYRPGPRERDAITKASINPEAIDAAGLVTGPWPRFHVLDIFRLWRETPENLRGQFPLLPIIGAWQDRALALEGRHVIAPAMMAETGQSTPRRRPIRLGACLRPARSPYRARLDVRPAARRSPGRRHAGLVHLAPEFDIRARYSNRKTRICCSAGRTATACLGRSSPPWGGGHTGIAPGACIEPLVLFGWRSSAVHTAGHVRRPAGRPRGIFPRPGPDTCKGRCRHRARCAGASASSPGERKAGYSRPKFASLLPWSKLSPRNPHETAGCNRIGRQVRRAHAAGRWRAAASTELTSACHAQHPANTSGALSLDERGVHTIYNPQPLADIRRLAEEEVTRPSHPRCAARHPGAVAQRQPVAIRAVEVGATLTEARRCDGPPWGAQCPCGPQRE